MQSIPASPPHASRPTARRLGAALLTALALTLSGAGSAVAHDELIGSDPEDGAVLEAAPEELRLTYSGDISSVGAQVEITGPDGVLEGEPVVQGTEVVHEMPAEAPAGDYSVLWRVTSSDGHPISGDLSFTVEQATEEVTEEATEEATEEGTATSAAPGTGTAQESADSATQDSAAQDGAAQSDSSPEPEEATTGPAPEAATDAPGASEDASQDGGSGPGIPTWAWVLVGTAVVALVGIGVTALRRRES